MFNPVRGPTSGKARMVAVQPGTMDARTAVNYLDIVHTIREHLPPEMLQEHVPENSSAVRKFRRKLDDKFHEMMAMIEAYPEAF